MKTKTKQVLIRVNPKTKQMIESLKNLTGLSGPKLIKRALKLYCESPLGALGPELDKHNLTKPDPVVDNQVICYMRKHILYSGLDRLSRPARFLLYNGTLLVFRKDHDQTWVIRTVCTQTFDLPLKAPFVLGDMEYYVEGPII